MSPHTYRLTSDPAWPWSIPGFGLAALGIVALLLIGLTVWTYIGVPRAGVRRTSIMVALRLGALLLVIFAVVRPSLASREDLKVPSTLILLVDASRSMNIADEIDNQTRWDAQRRTLARCEPILQRLQEQQNIKVHIYRFAEKLEDLDPRGSADGMRSDFGTALHEVYRQRSGERHLRGLLLLSDGANNGTRYDVVQEELPKWRSLACPVHTFCLGQSTTGSRQRDIIVHGITAEPSPVPVKNELKVQGLIDAFGFVGTPVYVRLKIDDKPVGSPLQVTLKSEKDNKVTLSTQAPEKPGEIKLTLSVDHQPNELNRDNNELSTYVTVAKEGLRVLYVERLRPDEPVGIRAALKVRGMNLTMMYRQSETALSEAEKEKLDFKKQHYDVIIIGDVSPRRLSGGDPDVLKSIGEAVYHKGSGLIMLGGYLTFGNSDWHEVKWKDDKTGTEHSFRELLPVELNVTGQEEGNVPMTPWPASRSSYVMRLSDKSEENQQIWQKLPPLKGATKLGRVKRTATTLATAGDPASEVPLLVSGSFGQGRTMAFGGDTTWRWRDMGLADRPEAPPEGVPYHNKFWQNVVLWLAKQDEQSGSVWVSLDERLLTSGSKLGMSVGARGKEGETLANARFEVTVTDPQGGKSTVPIMRDGESNRGIFWNTDLPGEYRVEVNAFAPGQDAPLPDVARARFVVRQDTTELLLQAANPKFMATIAASGGGKAFRLEDLPRVLEELRTQPLASARPKTEYYPDWRRSQTSAFLPSFFLAFVSLLCLEWFLRRSWGLV